MSPSDLGDVALSSPPHDSLQRLVQKLQDALGQQLVAVVLYGEGVAGGHASEQTEAPVLVVLQDVSTDLLDRMASAIQQGIRECRLSVMILSEDELRRSTDVFPIKFLNMQRHHRVLCGKDVLQDLEISTDHLRLRCEQEIKNLMLRLHQWYVLNATFPEQLERTLKRAVQSLLRDLAVMLELKTQTQHHQQEDVLRGAHELGLDVEPLRQTLALGEGNPEMDGEQIKELYNRFMRTVHRAAEIVDAL